jgi:hypothetical protein
MKSRIARTTGRDVRRKRRLQGFPLVLKGKRFDESMRTVYLCLQGNSPNEGVTTEETSVLRDSYGAGTRQTRTAAFR